MHPNPIFRTAATARNLAFARSRGFGILSVNGDTGPVLSHIPFLLADDGTHADLHLVRSNPIARMLGDGPQAVIAVSGPDGYVSPDWYGVADQVPTWNYVAVQLRGRLEGLPMDALRDLIDRQSADFESRLVPKPPWTSAKMTPDVLTRMMRQILPVRLVIDDIQGTWKLNQNKDDAVRLRAADAMDAHDPALAALMRDPDADI